MSNLFKTLVFVGCRYKINLIKRLTLNLFSSRSRAFKTPGISKYYESKVAVYLFQTHLRGMAGSKVSERLSLFTDCNVTVVRCHYQEHSIF